MLEVEEKPDTTFSMAEARHIVRDLFTPNPRIYWADFLLSLGIGSACFGRVLQPYGWWQHFDAGWCRPIALFLISCVLYYRAALFIHEAVHFRSGSFRAFRIVWNLLCGIPFLLPSFTYYTHLDHHRRKYYGTKLDGEYVPLGKQSTWAIWFYLSQCLIIPALAIVRFAVLTPLTWACPPLRRLVHQRASSLVMDPTYMRPLPTRDDLRIMRLQELGCFLFCAAVGVMLWRGSQPEHLKEVRDWAPALHGVLPIGFLLQAYLTGVFIVTVNAIRTLGAHRFVNDGREMTFVEQLVDSVNYPRWPLVTSLWAPVGLRFHALHHLFPSMPYHNLAKAHRRLMVELPADSPYRLTEESSLWRALRKLWHISRSAAGNPPTIVASP